MMVLGKTKNNLKLFKKLVFLLILFALFFCFDSAKALSSDATLKSISVEPYYLKQPFKSSTTDYDLLVPENETSVTIDAITNDDGATLTYNQNVTITSNPQVEQILVNAEDGTPKTYTITIRQVKETTLISGPSINGRIRSTGSQFGRITSIVRATYDEYLAKQADIQRAPRAYNWAIETETYPVYFWPDSSNVVHYYTEADVIYFNEDSSNMFQYVKTITSLDFSEFDTSRVKNMSRMFASAENIGTLDLSGWNTSNVTDMSLMFFENKNLQNLDISHFDTKNVTNMSYMLYGIRGVRTLNLSEWNTSNVTDMSCMFGSTGLTELDLSNFDTSKVTNMYFMFGASKSITTLDVSNFDTSKVTNMERMFEECNALTSLDLRSFDTSQIKVCIKCFIIVKRQEIYM